MWNFNVIVTIARDGIYRNLLQELAPLGDFRRTDFHGVIAGAVATIPSFLETVRSRREIYVIAFQDLGRIIPLEQVVLFHVEDFLATACELISPFLDRLAGRRFYVRLERRGHKGEIVSPEAERALDEFVLGELARQRKTAAIDFEAPDVVVALETLGDRLGIGLLTRELCERYDFVRIG